MTCEYRRFNRNNAACDKMNLSLTHKYDEHMIKSTSYGTYLAEYLLDDLWINTVSIEYGKEF